MRPSLRQLLYFLSIKSIVDLFFVGIFTASFFYNAFNPHLRGWLDDAGPNGITGWVYDERAPGKRVEVQLYIDGRFAESRQADFPRPDLVAAGFTRDEQHGFFFFMPPLEPGNHVASVYSVQTSGGGKRRALQRLGNPVSFTVEEILAEPFYRGWLDEANATSVRGWVINRAQMDERSKVQLFIDGHFVEERLADQPRPDLLAGGVSGDGRHGFFFFTPPLAAGEHEARAYVVQTGSAEQERTLRLIGRPVRFSIK